MTTIHHATLKRAAKLGIELALSDDEESIVASMNGRVFATGDNAKDVLAEAEQRIANGDEGDEDSPEELSEDDSEADGEAQFKGSIVKPKYRKQYAPKNDTCGDQMANDLASYLTHEGENGDQCLNVALLKRFAKANDCWVDNYDRLNPGQQRMNVGNRLRAKIRKGHEIRWVK